MLHQLADHRREVDALPLGYGGELGFEGRWQSHRQTSAHHGLLGVGLGHMPGDFGRVSSARSRPVEGIIPRPGEDLLQIATNRGPTDPEVACELGMEAPAQALASDMLQDGTPPQPGTDSPDRIIASAPCGSRTHSPNPSGPSRECSPLLLARLGV
jgi:hypothetical protein